MIQLSGRSSRLLSERKFYILAPYSLRVGRFSWPEFTSAQLYLLTPAKLQEATEMRIWPQTSNFSCTDIQHAKPDEFSGCRFGELPYEAGL